MSVLVTVMVGCASKPPSRYQQSQDSGPSVNRDLAHVTDAVPKVEPRSRGGNKSPYTVFGKQYWVMPSSAGYQATGTASWYGSKFHGHHTSNGEVYDMFAMSAAHKSLPIPTYLRVTNLKNDKQVIVRVNDRGPFHGDRLIDLSYAAATKLGFANQGTAQVRLEAIDPLTWNRPSPQPAKPNSATSLPEANPVFANGNIYLQVGAFSSFGSAQRLKQRLEILTKQSVAIYLDEHRVPQLHKVHIGPLANLDEANSVKEKILAQGLGQPLFVSLPKL